MTSLGSPSPFFLAGKKAYAVDRSLRFNDGDDTYLQRTVSSSSNRKTFTISAWIKPSETDSRFFFAVTDTSGYEFFYIGINSFHRLAIFNYDYPVQNLGFNTNRLFRDPSAWYHIVIAFDTTQATNTDRVKLYVNGVQETSWYAAAYPTQNLDTFVNHTTYPVYIGKLGWGGGKYHGYMAEYNFIDGLQLTPSSFGETDALTGQWNPKKYVGSYGTNGFYLNFSDNSGTTATTLGKDSSGNGNNFTPNNFVTGDAVKDSPTNNFCTLNPLSRTNKTASEGNLETRANDGAWRPSSTTFHMSSGKWYWELHVTALGTYQMHGIVPAVRADGTSNFNNDYYPGTYSDEWGYANDGALHNSASPTSSWGASYTTGDILSFALDMDNGTLDIKKNNSATGSQITGISTTKEYRPAFTNWATSSITNVNFGQDSSFAGEKTAQGNTDGSGQGDFYYAPPSGYKALCSANLPDPTILLPNKHFETVLYTGSGSGTQNITSLNFQPDWVWLKVRSTGGWHALVDSVRGVGKILASNEGDAENNSSDSQTAFSAFLSNGFTVGYNTSWYVNGTPSGSSTQVAWNWNAGDTDGKTYIVTVVSDSGNKYRFDGFGTSAVTLDLAEGGTYIFNMDDASNASHPFMIGTAADDATAPFGSGIVYKLDGVVKTFAQYHAGFSAASTRRLEFTIPASTNNLFYFCYSHNGMGGGVNTNTTLGSSNFDGSIQTTVKTNASAGFSIITYTGTGADATIGHGLGVTPNVAITKKRSGGGKNWNVKHSGAGGLSGYLDNTDAFDNNHSGQGIISNFSSSSTYSITRYNNEYTYDSVNASGETYVAYVFSGVAGYSKFGSFTGNGNNDGPFIYLGFSAALIIYKNASAGSTDWLMFDPKRIHDGTNLDYVEPNTSDAEGYLAVDILSNGFKLTHETNSKFNGSGNTFIYLAFAESPFKNARAR